MAEGVVYCKKRHGEAMDMGIAIGLAFAAMCLFYLAFQRLKRTPGCPKGVQIAVKCAATGMAALVALLGCLRDGSAAHWVLLAGLVACTVADGVLCVRFIAGGAIFALGHALYMVAFCLMRGPDWRSAAVFVFLMGLASAGLARFGRDIGRGRGLLYAYAAVLSMMVALAAVQAPLYFAGALLFALSDALLGYLAVKPGHDALDYVSLGTYYLGQFLLGLAVAV